MSGSYTGGRVGFLHQICRAPPILSVSSCIVPQQRRCSGDCQNRTLGLEDSSPTSHPWDYLVLFWVSDPALFRDSGVLYKKLILLNINNISVGNPTQTHPKTTTTNKAPSRTWCMKPWFDSRAAPLRLTKEDIFVPDLHAQLAHVRTLHARFTQFFSNSHSGAHPLHAARGGQRQIF